MQNKKVVTIVVIVSLALLGLGVWYFGGEKLKRVQRLQDAMSSGFEYYGKVVDQHGEPVVGADVLVQWGYFPFIPNGDFSPSYKNLTFTTDKEGRFSIKKRKGMSLAFGRNDIKKEGYEIDAYRAYMFSDGGYKMLQSFSDPNKPVIFHAWKKTEAEPLVYNDILIGFSPDGKSYALDLIKPEKVLNGNSGDIRVRYKRPKDAKRNEGFNWSVTIEALGGGLIETTDVFMNEAPVEGYKRSWSVNYEKGDPKFQSRLSKKFYLKSRGGKVYGRLELEFMPIYNDESVIDAKWWLNPNGSRNLQYDPEKRIYLK